MSENTADIMIEELPDLPQPLNILEALRGPGYSFFLDSACGAEKLGRFSFLGCDPFLVFRSKGDSISLEWRDGNIEVFRANPFIALKDIFGRYRMPAGSMRFPFLSGGVGYFAYDLKDFTERLVSIAADDLNIPDCIMGFYDVVIIYDNASRRAYIASSGMPETDAFRASARAKRRLEEFKARIRSGRGPESLHSPMKRPDPASNFSKAQYMKTIERAKSYIRKGDIYQVNLSQRFHSKLGMDPLELYSRLRISSPAPFSAYLDFGDVSVLSSSPERFLLKRGSYIETRPIKGTRPRGPDALSDSFLGAELLQSEKDRAEHIMIVDLERNDLGRICEYGSVYLQENMALEKYSNVFHLVSTVSGRLKEGTDPIDCLLAAFPGGSITGAPKIRSMEIIEELEPVKRSVYTGAIGYISFDGDMDTSIVIRTFLVKEDDVYFQVGGGIVADSDPELEYEETLHKAKGLLEALGMDLVKSGYRAIRTSGGRLPGYQGIRGLLETQEAT